MKGYTKFIVGLSLVLALYILAEINRPKEIKWDLTLENDDKNPFGAYILFQQLREIFPQAGIKSYRLPVYNQLNHFHGVHTAYLLIAPELKMSKEDVGGMLDYVRAGNYVFMASNFFSRSIWDTLHFKIRRRFDADPGDSITINLTNPSLRLPKNLGFKHMTMDGYLNAMDTAKSVVLGKNHLNDANFIKINYGNGAFFVHALPVCFSNYFMLTGHHAAYTAAALSYLPGTIRTIYWDEYYKSGLEGSQNPLRFILNNRWLAWAFRIALITIVLFVLFEMKRTQRIIPEISQPGNSTLDFVRTVGKVYFNKRDNKNIALKKINYLYAFIRSNLFISTNRPDEAFVQELANKTSVEKEAVSVLVGLIRKVQLRDHVDDELLLELNKSIDHFYGKLNV